MIAFKHGFVNPATLQVDGVYASDYPEFCEAYFCYAEWANGDELSDLELEQFTEENYDLVNEIALDQCVGAADDYRDRMMDMYNE